MAISASASKKETQYIWEGKDKRGNKVRGKSLAANEQSLRADLRRQGVAPTRVKDAEQCVPCRWQSYQRRHRRLRAPVGNHDVRRYPDGSSV